MILLGVLGGFTQNQITQAPPEAKNNAFLNTLTPLQPYDLLPLTPLSSGEINKALS